MDLSDMLQDRLNAHRAVRSLEVAREKKQRKADRLFMAGLALAAVTSAVAFSVGVKHPTSTLPPAPVSPATPVVAPAPAPVVAPVAAPVKSNGGHDAFQDRLDRAFAPYDSQGRPQN